MATIDSRHTCVAINDTRHICMATIDSQYTFTTAIDSRCTFAVDHLYIHVHVWPPLISNINVCLLAILDAHFLPPLIFQHRCVSIFDPKNMCFHDYLQHTCAATVDPQNSCAATVNPYHI